MNSRKSIALRLFVVLLSYATSLPLSAQTGTVVAAPDAAQGHVQASGTCTNGQPVKKPQPNAQILAGNGETVSSASPEQECNSQTQAPECEQALCVRRGSVKQQVKNSSAGFYHTFGGGLIGGGLYGSSGH